MPADTSKSKRLTIQFNSDKRSFNLSGNVADLYNVISNEFKIDLNLVDSFFLQNIKDLAVCPLTINNIINDSNYFLLIRYKVNSNDVPEQQTQNANGAKNNMQGFWVKT